MHNVAEISAIAEDVSVEPITPRLGAVVRGIDARAELPAKVVEHVSSLLMQFKVLFLPGLNLDYAEQARFASQFGPLRTDPVEDSVPGYPGLSLLDNVPFFHADWMFQEDPPKWAMLQMTTVPEVGGDTVFVDLVTSYADLSLPMRRFLEELTVYQAMDEGHAAKLERSYIDRHGTEGDDYRVVHQHLQPSSKPLVRWIPETGRNNYWITQAYSRRINELSQGESDALLGFLFRHLMAPQYCIRWRWRPGDIAFWDHRTTLHSGMKDYGDFERHGCRASIAGGAVISAAGRPGGSGR